MLSYFKIRNFKSILDLNLNLSYDEGKVPNNYENLPFHSALIVDDKRKFVPVLSLFGPNACGKTNVITAIRTFLRVLKNGIATSQDSQFLFGPDYFRPYDIYSPNKLNDKFNSTEFEMGFFIDNDEFFYSLEYDKEKIIKDKLVKNNSLVYEINNCQLNTANIESQTYTQDIFKDYFDIDLSYIDNSGQRIQYRPFLSLVLKDDRLRGLGDFFKIKEFFENKINIRMVGGGEWGYKTLTPIEDIEKFIRKFDIDIRKIEPIEKEHKINLSKDDVFTQKEIIYKTIHKDIHGNDVEFNLKRDESLGTNSLFIILDKILWTLKNGGVLVVDELDRSLHPVIVIQLIKLFKDKDYNKNKAQLIFTCHLTDVLENQLLRKSEVAILTKTLQKGTIIKRISDISKDEKEIRNAYDFRRLYLEDAFGGLPYAYI